MLTSDFEKLLPSPKGLCLCLGPSPVWISVPSSDTGRGFLQHSPWIRSHSCNVHFLPYESAKRQKGVCKTTFSQNIHPRRTGTPFYLMNLSLRAGHADTLAGRKSMVTAERKGAKPITSPLLGRCTNGGWLTKPAGLARGWMDKVNKGIRMQSSYSKEETDSGGRPHVCHLHHVATLLESITTVSNFRTIAGTFIWKDALDSKNAKIVPCFLAARLNWK